jgi:hypothetical protein
MTTLQSPSKLLRAKLGLVMPADMTANTQAEMKNLNRDSFVRP